MRRYVRYLMPVLAALLLPPGQGGARAETTVPPLLVIVDGSGSMWGNFEGTKEVKFYSVRDALVQSLAQVPADARVGLLSFGHRRKSDCSDVELVVPPEAGAPERITVPIEKLNPRGKGPLSAGLKEAAKALGPGKPGTILLLSDGPDNCQQDACLAAADLAKTNPGTPIHVVGLGLERADAPRAACIAKATGGRFFDARDAAQMTGAIGEALKLARLEDARPPQAALAPATGGAQAEQDTEGPPALRLAATLAPGGGELTAPVAWTITKSGAASPVLERTAATVAEPMMPGTYTVEASYGLATARQTVEVAEKGATRAAVNLNAGLMKIAGLPGGTPDTPRPLVTITPRTKDPAAGKAAGALWIGREALDIAVPAGSYTVRVEDGAADRETAVEIAAGGQAAPDVQIPTGRLDLAAIAYEGGPTLEDIMFVVARDDPDAPQGRREVARSAAPHPDFKLAAGTYYVSARSGQTEVKDRVAIGTAGAVTHTFVLGLAGLSVNAAVDPALLAPGQALTFRALRIEGDQKMEAARVTGMSAEFLLAQGRYRVEAQIGNGGISTGQDIDVVAGKPQKLTLRLDVAQLIIKPMPEAGRTWELRDAAGKLVMRSGRGEGRTGNVAPGRYVMNYDGPARRLFKELELRAGEQRTIDLSQP